MKTPCILVIQNCKQPHFAEDIFSILGGRSFEHGAGPCVEILLERAVVFWDIHKRGIHIFEIDFCCNASANAS